MLRNKSRYINRMAKRTLAQPDGAVNAPERPPGLGMEKNTKALSARKLEPDTGYL
jgi:hypothetical protein